MKYINNYKYGFIGSKKHITGIYQLKLLKNIIWQELLKEKLFIKKRDVYCNYYQKTCDFPKLCSKFVKLLGEQVLFILIYNLLNKVTNQQPTTLKKKL